MPFLAPSNALAVYRGASRTLNLTVLQAKTKTPVDLSTPVRLLFSVKEGPDERPALIQKSTDFLSEITIITPREGKAKIYIEALDTQRLSPGAYQYDVWLYFLLTGKRYIIVEPTLFEVKAAITYAPLP